MARETALTSATELPVRSVTHFTFASLSYLNMLKKTKAEVVLQNRCVQEHAAKVAVTSEF